MKSHQLGFFGLSRRSRHLKRQGTKRAELRRGIFESLERRDLMSADWNPAIAAATGAFTTSAARASFLETVASRAASNSSFTSGEFAEGLSNTNITGVVEAEPNNARNSPQFIPFGLKSGQSFGVNVTGTNTSDDQDWYSFDLAGGDIIDIAVSGPFPGATLSLYNSANRELATTITIFDPENPRTFNGAFPSNSPLTGSTSAPSANNSIHYVVPSDGRYFFRLSDVRGAYTARFRAYRPTLESQPAGTKQTLFLDFDGEFLSRSLFGIGAGSLGFNSIGESLAVLELNRSDENQLISEIVARVTDKFNQIGLTANNPDYGITILNSRDHADPWGLPNVSRVVIGGLGEAEEADDIFDGLLGISESVDAGNFNTSESAVVVVPNFADMVEEIEVSGSATRLQLAAEVIARTTAHEAGHSFGLWHQDANNNVFLIMDQTSDSVNRAGAGPDEIFGTADDVPSRFGVDTFAGGGGSGAFRLSGTNDSINWLGWSLTTGKQGGSVEGTIFQDTNLNRSLDQSDTRVSDIVVYADINNNGVHNQGEPSTRSKSDGTYSLLVANGSYTVRTIIPTGFRAVAPLSNSYAVTVSNNANVTGRNFGYELIQSTATGRKWNDANGNGLRDNGEPSIGGTWIYIDLDGDSRLDIGEPATQTKADGTYTLPNPGAGTFVFREVIEPGWVQSHPGPSRDFGHTVTLTGNAVNDAPRLIGLDFGNQILVDYSDAPVSFGTASHGFLDGLRLGSLWDSEAAAQFSETAVGDDVNGVNDDDGVVLSRPLVRGSAENRIRVTTTNTTGQPAYLNAWMDFNGNGTFDTNERIFTDRVLAAGENQLSFSIPSTTALASISARFRYSSQSGVSPTGLAGGGEVEDYQFLVTNAFNLAVDDTASVRTGSSGNSIDVLANDFRTAGETLTVVRTSGVTSVGGIATVSGDRTRVLYSPPAGFTGTDTFTYTMQNSLGEQATATVVVSVNLFFENPQALDDSFDVPVNGQDIPLNVLANDIEGQGGALSIISVTQPDKGGAIAIATGGKSLRYTPARSFGGTESFTYTAMDASGARSTARVTLHTIPGARLDDQVLIQFLATDLSGNQISSIAQGQEFKIRVIVDDLRHDANNPGTSAGVFAAFMDMLYSAQLVSLKPDTTPGARFNFDVDFLNNYTNDTTGDASIPGVINEFGGANSAFNMNNPNPTVMAEVTFTARAAGIANFMPDPADDEDRSDTLLFNVSSTPVPKERIRYLGTQLQIFGDGTQFPQAVDDSANVAVNAVRAQIDVLANDQRGSTGSVQIVAVTQGARGAVSIENRNGNSADPIITYSPNSNFSGFDQFTYTIQDSRGVPSFGTVSVRVGELATANTTAAFDLVVTDLNGNSIDQIQSGQQFQLRGFVQDVRAAGSNRGLFTAYTDVLFNSNLVSPVLSSTNNPNLGFVVSFGPQYGQVREGDVRIPGIINEIGAQSSNDTPLGSGQFLLFVVTMTANNIGTAIFQTNPADITPFHDTLTWIPAEPVTPDKIRFGTDQLRIVAASGGGASGEFHNSNRPLDVNNDGNVSAIDALLVINTLNGIQINGSGEGESVAKFYPDTSGDGRVSALDALLVINQLNSRSQGGSGEGESNSQLSAPLASASASSSKSVAAVEQSVGNPLLGDDNDNTTASPNSLAQSYATQVDLSMQDEEKDDQSIEELLETLAAEINEKLGTGLAS